MQQTSDIAFETDRLILQPWSADDEAAYRAIYTDPAVTEFLALPHESPAETQARCLRHFQTNLPAPPGCGRWKLTERASGRIVGTLLLKPLPNSDDIEIGWHLARAAWGRGFATEAANAALARGFEQLGLKRIFAIVDPTNIRSKRVCVRLGMGSCGYTTRFHGMELELYVIDRVAWSSQRAACAKVT